MDNSEIDWMVSNDATSAGRPYPGYEWYGARLAEKAFKPDMADIELLDLCLYLRGKILDDDAFNSVADQTELLLVKRMSGGLPITSQVRGSPGFDPDEHRAALDALYSGKLKHMELIDLAELAQVNCNDDLDIGGAEWEVIYDLARIQILRRIKRTPAFGVATVKQLPSSFDAASADCRPLKLGANDGGR